MAAPAAPARSSTLSLKGRALRWLAQREHSRAELRRKLLPHARAESDDPTAAATRVDELLDWLERERHLSHERFVESRVNARAARLGTRRIAAELAEHGLALPPGLADSLRGGELERARAIWVRRFGEAAADASGRARQARFLIGRGFSPEVVRRIVRGAGNDED
jgi:regulatory protein